MKNILAENMLRFGVKNLNESDKKKLTLNEAAAVLSIYDNMLATQTKPGIPGQKSSGAPLTRGGDQSIVLLATYPSGLKFQNGIGYGKTSDGSQFKIVSKDANYQNGTMTVSGDVILWTSNDGKTERFAPAMAARIPALQIDASRIGTAPATGRN